MFSTCKITKCSRATATQGISDLLKIGTFQKFVGGDQSPQYNLNLPVVHKIGQN